MLLQCPTQGAQQWIRVGFECFLLNFSKLCCGEHRRVSLVRDGEKGARPSWVTAEGAGTLEYSSSTSCSQQCSTQTRTPHRSTVLEGDAEVRKVKQGWMQCQECFPVPSSGTAQCPFPEHIPDPSGASPVTASPNTTHR